MPNRRDTKVRREDWTKRASAMLDRPELATPAAHPIVKNAESEKLRRSKNRSLHEVAHEEWMKWAQVVVDRLAAVVPDFVPLPMPSRYLDNTLPQKPTHSEWTMWSEIVVERLTTCVHVYNKPKYVDVFMADKERLEKNARALDLLRRIHALTDDAGAPTDSLIDLQHHDERVMAGLKVLMKETLAYLPELSTDMQKLMKSPWFEKCNGRLATELFIGPAGREREGIGSGHSVHGRLPEALQDLLEREESGHNRNAVEDHADPQSSRWHDEAHRRWGRNNAQSLRSAGRVE